MKRGGTFRIFLMKFSILINSKVDCVQDRNLTRKTFPSLNQSKICVMWNIVCRGKFLGPDSLKQDLLYLFNFLVIMSAHFRVVLVTVLYNGLRKTIYISFIIPFNKLYFVINAYSKCTKNYILKKSCFIKFSIY